MSQSKSRRVAHCMYVEIELKKKKRRKKIDFESLVLRKFRKITAISHPCIPSAWMMFLLPAIIRLGHEGHDLLSLCDELRVCTD